MRVVTVLGVMTVGAGLGTAAVLAPLNTGAPANSWLVDWDVPVVRQMAAMFPASSRPQPVSVEQSAAAARSAENTVVVPAVQPAGKPALGPQGAVSSPDQNARTLEYLSKPNAKAADARGLETPWATNVTPAADAAPRGRPSSKPANEEQRRELARNIQNELKRVGCYDGPADGQWNSSTKRAMGEFTERVNASLPFDEPDLILLTLVKGQRGTACGEACPAGQGLNQNGQCRPNSVMARAERAQRVTPLHVAEHQAKVDRVETPLAAQTAEAARKSVTPVEPVPVPVPAIRRPAANGAVSVATALGVAPERAKAAEPAEVVVRSAPALSGRMAIGGPLPAALVEEPAPVTSSAKPEAVEPDEQVASSRRHRPVPAAVALPQRRALPPVVVHRSPPQRQQRPTQYTAVQKPPKWHPVNPFW